jgi:hypothetical protein
MSGTNARTASSTASADRLSGLRSTAATGPPSNKEQRSASDAVDLAGASG